MSRSTNRGLLLAVALAALTPVAAVAQNADTDGNVATETEYRTVEREDNDFPWGLLGLLGLAGLLGRKKKAPDVVVDNRHNTRP